VAGQPAVQGDRFPGGVEGLAAAAEPAEPDPQVVQRAGQEGLLGVGAGEAAVQRDRLPGDLEGLPLAAEPVEVTAEVEQDQGQVRAGRPAVRAGQQVTERDASLR
jgi:hypothetical protein